MRKLNDHSLFSFGPVVQSIRIDSTEGRYINEIADELDPELFEAIYWEALAHLENNKTDKSVKLLKQFLSAVKKKKFYNRLRRDAEKVLVSLES